MSRWDTTRPPPDEREVRAILSAEHLAPYAWGNPPDDRYALHSHIYHKIVYCLTGSIVFHLPEPGETVELSPGDRIDLMPGTAHAALVGPAGVVCLEAHRPR